MLKICLSRKGKKKQPVYRIVVTEKHKDPWGDVLEVLGLYNPRSTPKHISFKKDRIEYWMSKGAQLSATVHNMMVNEKVVEGSKRRVVQPKLKEKAPAATTPQAPEASGREAGGPATIPPKADLGGEVPKA